MAKMSGKKKLAIGAGALGAAGGAYLGRKKIGRAARLAGGYAKAGFRGAKRKLTGRWNTKKG